MDDADPQRTEALGEASSTHPEGRRVVVGDVLNGRYLLLRVLGRGGMAAVWRAEDRVLQRDVAIKIFDGSAALPDASARTVAEVQLLAGLSHPGLVAVYDAGVHGEQGTGDQFDFLVMELADGPTLRQRIDRGRLGEDEAAVVGAQLAEALDYVHGRGVVHRDVKPANILLVGQPDEPRAKLTDFGVARVLDNDRMTLNGTTLGTANYLSPEQATGGEIGPPTDVYALGLVLLECLTGVLAYEGHGIAAAAARLQRPPHIPQWVPPAWQDLLAGMTALQPAQRPAMGDVARALTAIAVGVTGPALPPPAPAVARVPTSPTPLLPVAPASAQDGQDVTDLGAAGWAPPPGSARRRRGGLAALFTFAGLVIAAGAVFAVSAAFNGGGKTPGGVPGPSASQAAKAPVKSSAPTSRSSAELAAATAAAHPPTERSARRSPSSGRPSGPASSHHAPGKTSGPTSDVPAGSAPAGPGKSSPTSGQGKSSPAAGPSAPAPPSGKAPVTKSGKSSGVAGPAARTSVPTSGTAEGTP